MKTLLSLLLAFLSVGLAGAATVNYNTTGGSALSCNGIAGCVPNTSTSITIGGITMTYNTGSGSGVATPSVINLGNLVTTGTGTNVDFTGVQLTINVNSTPPGGSGALPIGSIAGLVSTNTSSLVITWSPSNTTTGFGTLPGVIISGGGQAFAYQLIDNGLGLQPPTVGNPIGQTSIQGAVSDTTLPPTISKSFTPASVAAGGITTLAFTISNPNPATTLNNVSVSDTLPAPLLVATPNGLTGSCGGGTITATAGSNLISLSGGVLAAGVSCTFSVNVQTAGSGVFINLSNAVSATESGAGGSATASLLVLPPDAYQVRYVANLTAGESYINIINTGGNGGVPVNGPGFGANNGGNMCVNVYTLDPNEELLNCCSCLVTPDQIVNLKVQAQLMGNTLTGFPTSSAVIKIVGSSGPGTTALAQNAASCTNSSATVTSTLANGSLNVVEGGFIAFGSTLHASSASSFAVTETRFIPSTLSISELVSLTTRCAAILGNASGAGICSGCAKGALGAGKK